MQAEFHLCLYKIELRLKGYVEFIFSILNYFLSLFLFTADIFRDVWIKECR